MDKTESKMLFKAYELAKASYEQGGIPIGSVLTRAGRIIGRGHNQRVQQGDPIAHGEMDCLRNAGRQKGYGGTTLFTTLSPCMMCAGTVVQLKIPRIIIGENRTFGGNESFLRRRGIEVVVANDQLCYELMQRFVREKPKLWNEDISE